MKNIFEEKIVKNKKLRGIITELNEVKDIQGADGTWNYDHYMLGMYNGMEICIAILEDRKPVYRSAPEVWGRDKKVPNLAKLAKNVIGLPPSDKSVSELGYTGLDAFKE
jgi:hypothetical protein